MNKTELIEIMANHAGVTKKIASDSLDAFIEAIKQGLKSGDKISIPGFCSISVGVRAARTGRNPQTGNPINIPASRTVKIKAGKELKDVVKD
ncbi:MAG: HU family DNA-binding protein [Proteobacteria bacterium]|nr:HU family DNA-binding protein [Pseudomonadota bacterium]